MKTKASKDNQNVSSNVSELQNLVRLLKSGIEKIVNCSKNLDLMLGGQKPYLDKTRLRFGKEDDEQSSKKSLNLIPACIYYFKKGHTSEKCFSRRKAEKQKVKKTKMLTNPKGPKKMWVLKEKIFADATMF